MHMYLKPQTLKDLYEEATPFKTVNVHKTGSKDSSQLKCVKMAVLPLIPKDDALVRAAVMSWDDEVQFGRTVGRMCDMSKLSFAYDYNSVKLSVPAMVTLLTEAPCGNDADVVFRPRDSDGACHQCCACYDTFRLLAAH